MDLISLQDLRPNHPKGEEKNNEPIISQFSSHKQRKYSECLNMEPEEKEITLHKMMSGSHSEEKDNLISDEHQTSPMVQHTNGQQPSGTFNEA